MHAATILVADDDAVARDLLAEAPGTGYDQVAVFDSE
jgi:CheY-like chemotaxis protein